MLLQVRTAFKAKDREEWDTLYQSLSSQATPEQQMMLFAWLASKPEAQPMLQSQEIKIYLDYLNKLSRIMGASLLDEKNKLERDIYDQILTTDEGKRLRSVDEYLRLIKKGLLLSLTPSEYVELMNESSETSDDMRVAFINDLLLRLSDDEVILGRWNDFEQAARTIHDFYQMTYKRDEAFLAKLQSNEEQNQFVIAGGYHTANLIAEFEARDWNYVVLTPRVETETERDVYETIMTAQSKGSRSAMRPRSIRSLSDAMVRAEVLGARLTGDEQILLFEIFRKEGRQDLACQKI